MYPLPTSEEILTSIIGFLYATGLDLNMGYLSIPLSEHARKILTVVMPFRFFQCLVLPMGVTPATDIFQARMVSVLASMRENKPSLYIDDILLTKGRTFEEHLQLLATCLRLLMEAGMQVNATKSNFCQKSLEFLG